MPALPALIVVDGGGWDHQDGTTETLTPEQIAAAVTVALALIAAKPELEAKALATSVTNRPFATAVVALLPDAEPTDP